MAGFGLVSVLRMSMRVWRQNFVAFTAIALVLYAPALVMHFLIPDWQWSLLMWPITTAVNTLIAAAVTYGVIMELHGTRPSHAQCITRGFAQLAPAFGASMLALLAIFGGFVLLVVPGIIVSLMLWVVVPVAIIEKPGATEALRRSRALTQGHKGTLFVILLLEIAVSYAFDHAAADAFEWDVYVLVSFAFDALVGLFYAITAAVAYTQLRQLEEGIEMPVIARALATVRRRA